ncbi:unnamed protein product [Spodoptera exigua]|nr:unnamed protein product [Spodoptera exigua]
MKFVGLLALLLVSAVALAEEEEVEEAPECDLEACKLPNCRCSGVDIPGGLSPRDTPQFVTVTFDDGVNVNNIITYRNILYNRFNSNGCPAGVTFFVSHEYTNYVLINELYNRGFEIALHSISHQIPQTYWRDATYDDLKKEIADQKVQMSHFANIPSNSIKGVRLPFLQMAGDNSFQVMADYGLEYDCTWPTTTQTNPGLWPYTLDYKSNQDCVVPPCPTSSIPGVWVKPMVAWSDLQGVACSMVDACFFIPDRENEEEWFKFIMTNFERHYLGNRAPFGFYVHEAFISAYPAVQRAFVRFMDVVNNLPDAFMVNAHEVIDWVKNPVPIDVYKKQGCRRFTPTNCNIASCSPPPAAHNGVQYWMQLCNVCPRVYPWLGNPLGQMRVTILVSVLFLGLVSAELPLAKECNEELCKLPNCRCSSTDIPGGLLPRDTPQFITLTFDDGVNIRNIETYRDILYNRTGANGCPIGTTFYVSHEYTDYALVNELYNQGYEIALHSISHRTPTDFWASASYKDIKEEIIDQKDLIAHFANIPRESIRGVRLPFLQLAGNTSYQVMADHGLEYDSSWPTSALLNPGLWPYTLDYASIQDCPIHPCPSASIPKPWVQPMLSFRDEFGFPCAMADSCFYTPQFDDVDAWYKFFMRNFERQYLGNRAPFGFYIHEWYLVAYPGVKAAYIKFLDTVTSLNDVFLVNHGEVLDWVKNPVPLNEYMKKPCKTWTRTGCDPNPCLCVAEHNQNMYYFSMCTKCPRVYPWVGNPLGL